MNQQKTATYDDGLPTYTYCGEAIERYDGKGLLNPMVIYDRVVSYLVLKVLSALQLPI